MLFRVVGVALAILNDGVGDRLVIVLHWLSSVMPLSAGIPCRPQISQWGRGACR